MLESANTESGKNGFVKGDDMLLHKSIFFVDKRLKPKIHLCISMLYGQGNAL